MNLDPTILTPNQLVHMANGLRIRMDELHPGPGSQHNDEWTELDAAFELVTAQIEHLMGRDWLIANVLCPQQ